MSHVCTTILPVLPCICQTLLPGQRLGRHLDWTNISIGLASPLPCLDITMINKVPMQPQLELQGQVHHGQRPLGQMLGVEDEDIVPQHVEMIHKRDQVPLPLRAVFFGDERGFLDRRRRPEKEYVLLPFGKRLVQVPGVVSQTIKQPSCWRPALGEVVRKSRIRPRLPEVFVFLGDKAVIDTGELAVGRPGVGRCDMRVGLSLGIEDPACSRATEFVGPGLPSR